MIEWFYTEEGEPNERYTVARKTHTHSLSLKVNILHTTSLPWSRSLKGFPRPYKPLPGINYVRNVVMAMTPKYKGTHSCICPVAMHDMVKSS